MASGRLSPPFVAASVRRYCARSQSEDVATDLQGLLELGASLESLSSFLVLLADERSSRPPLEDLVDLVLTGPEVPGAAYRDTAIVVRNLFAKATSSVLVAGYAVYQGKAVFSSLADRMAEIPNLTVQLFLDVQRTHGDTSDSAELVTRFVRRFKSQEWPGETLPEVFYDPRSLETDQKKKASLHAKCVVVDEEQAFISSANFTEAAQERNIEVGLLIRSQRISKQLAQHFRSLAAAGALKPLPGLG